MQECHCNKLDDCKICRSKYNRIQSEKRSKDPEARKAHAEYCALVRKYETPEEREKRLAVMRDYQRRLRAKMKEIKNETD